MNCKFCESSETVKYGVRRGIQYYKCKSCERTFADRDAPERGRCSYQVLGMALNMFYEGSSLGKIQRQIQQIYLEYFETSTIYRWVVKYTKSALQMLDDKRARSGHTWVVDETVIKLDSGLKLWFWDVIDEKTRFLLGSHLSPNRTISDVVLTLKDARANASRTPRFIITDSMPAYPEGIERVFGAESHHLKIKGITHEINTNLIERFHGTLKDRTKIMRGLKNSESAKLFLNGFLVHYNFFRPHMSLRDRTPAVIAGINLPFRNWEGLIRYQC